MPSVEAQHQQKDQQVPKYSLTNPMGLHSIRSSFAHEFITAQGKLKQYVCVGDTTDEMTVLNRKNEYVNI
jgi:hypothetical protein